MSVPRQIDSPIRAQLKLFGLFWALPLLDRASDAEVLAYYVQLCELALSPEIIL